MALKALMLRKKLNDARKALEALRAKDAEFEKREKEIEASIEEAEAEEERAAVEEAVESFEADKKQHEDEKAGLERQITDLEKDLEKEEAEQDTTPAEQPPKQEERKEEKMETRSIENLVTREDVKAYLGEVRTAIKEKRALTNVGLTIPEVMLGLIRENIINYSKLYKHVNVRRVSGDGRQVIMGTIPEAVWTDCCANLNELSLSFSDVEVGCWRVGGYFPVCNATLEDSDVDLASELLTAIGAGIGLALDKAILYGTGDHMPLGIVTRLVQTEAPAGYPATARPWVDLHTSNVKSIAASNTGTKLFQAFVTDSGAAKGKYSRGGKVWCMNETTYTKLVSEAMAIDAGGAIVSGVNGAMPVIGGTIEVLDFIPDNVIVGGYFDLYLLAERSGQKFATSEHVRFLNDQTVMKGTARYDGKPSIAEGFVAIGIAGTTPNATMSFAADTANT